MVEEPVYGSWPSSLARAQAAEATGIDKPVLAVDGKMARRSHDRSKGLGALHTVSVWASDFGLALGQVACAEQSNEITAIPELLRLVPRDHHSGEPSWLTVRRPSC